MDRVRLGIVVAAMMLAACSDDDGGDAGSTGSSTAATSTATTTTASTSTSAGTTTAATSSTTTAGSGGSGGSGSTGGGLTCDGTFPAQWQDGTGCPGETPLQVHRYDTDTYIIRQSLCTDFEAPFLYLLFGEDRVLLEDTGAGGVAVGQTVYGIIDEWLAETGRAQIELVVVNSHAHGDHVQGNGQFAGQPNTVVVGTQVADLTGFFGIGNWPTETAAYDLGGRVVDVIPIPGHQSAHIALYDRQAGLLLTGDSLYPGRVFVSDFDTFVTSMQALVDFVDPLPVCHVLGTHVEMSNTPGVDFNLGSTVHPDEHPLALTRDHLIELRDGVAAMQGNPQREVHDEFIIFPL